MLVSSLLSVTFLLGLTNTLAFYITELITAVKRFMVEALGHMSEDDCLCLHLFFVMMNVNQRMSELNRFPDWDCSKQKVGLLM
jgi:hypothetical protein